MAPETICTTVGDLAALEAKADTMVAGIVGTLEGSPPPGCGDGVVSGAESCDGANLGGETCATLGCATGTLACTGGCGFDVSGCVACMGQEFPATGQTTCWNSSGIVIPCAGTGHDGEIQAGATLGYTDKGDGTIIDRNTGFVWEKLSDDGSVHDKDNYYTWDNAFTVHAATLNAGAGFAGYNDWRVPNVKELQSIVNYEIVYPGPTVSLAFNTGCAPGCTVLIATP